MDLIGCWCRSSRWGNDLDISRVFHVTVIVLGVDLQMGKERRNTWERSDEEEEQLHDPSEHLEAVTHLSLRLSSHIRKKRWSEVVTPSHDVVCRLCSSELCSHTHTHTRFHLLFNSLSTSPPQSQIDQSELLSVSHDVFVFYQCRRVFMWFYRHVQLLVSPVRQRLSNFIVFVSLTVFSCCDDWNCPAGGAVHTLH